MSDRDSQIMHLSAFLKRQVPCSEENKVCIDAGNEMTFLNGCGEVPCCPSAEPCLGISQCLETFLPVMRLR